MARKYSNLYAGGTLAGAISNATTAITLSNATGLPASFPYTLTIDDGLPTMEAVEVTNASGVNLTVTRGVDGTAAVSHGLGASVTHSHTARDFSEPQVHIDATAAHGATGANVGTTNVQTLTNKTVSASTNTLNGFTASRFVTSDGTGRAVSTQTKAIPAGVVVGDTDSQTLTNKTLTSGTNTFPSTLLTTTGSQTVTNKNLASLTNVGGVAVVQKTADTARTNNTLADDPNLTLAIGATGMYEVSFNLIIQSASTTPDFAFRFTHPTATNNTTLVQHGYLLSALPADRLFSSDAQVLTGGTATASASINSGIVANFPFAVMGNFLFTCSATGTLTLQWAQSVTNVTSTDLKAGSYLKVQRLS